MFVNRIPLVLCGLPLLAFACGGGGGSTTSDGGPGPGQLLVVGVVRSPGGQGIDLLVARPRIARGDNQGIELPGYLPVPDFTDVELVRVAPNGNLLSIIARGSTVNGRYSFDLDGLNQEYSTQLMVRAGSGASQMRALATLDAIDVDPLSEAVTALLLQQAGQLDRLTFQEVKDTRLAVEFLAITQNLQAQADVASTVASLNQVIFAEPGLIEYVNLASAPGQTNAGPGDLGNFFPNALGNTWVMQGVRTIDDGVPEPFDTARRILVQDEGEYSVATSSPPDSRNPHFSFLEKTTAAVVDHGTSEPGDPLQDVFPYDSVHFPIDFRSGRLLYEVLDVPAGRDFDDDGTEDLMDAFAHDAEIRIEDVATTIGLFPGCLGLQQLYTSILKLSGGGGGSSTREITRWYAPGLGLVRERGTSQLVLNGQVVTNESYNQTLRDYVSGETGLGVLPPLTLAQGVANDPDSERPGRPSIGFDGTNYLVVTCREQSGVSQLVGTIVGPQGLPELEIPIIGLPAPECRPAVAVAFGGTYLVTYVERNGETSRIRGVRITRSGQVLDPEGFDISSGPEDSQPTIAFDDSKYAVVWRRASDTNAGELFATFVTTLGGVLPEFALEEAIGGQREPHVSFGSGAYLCVWSDDRSGMSEIRGSRFDTLGTVLGDPAVLLADATVAEGDGAPQVAFDGTAFFIAWLRTSSAKMGLRHIAGMRMSVKGALPDAEPIFIRTADMRNESLSLDYDGEDFVCVWETLSDGDAAGIHMARVSVEGLLLDGSPSGPARKLARQPMAGFISHPIVKMAGLSGERGGLVAWFLTSKAERKLEGLRVLSF